MSRKVADIQPTQEQYKKLHNRYAKDPVKFCRVVCGIEPQEWQERFLKALLTDKFIVRPSGHSTGKTKITSVAMLWMLFCFRDCHIRATSATFDQLKNVMWQTLRETLAMSAISLWADIDETKVVNKFLPVNWIRAVAWSVDKPQAWAGEHCHSPIGVFDECSDIDSSIFEAWSGSSHHEGSRTILLGQPRLRTGKLFKAAHDPKYNVEHISSFGNPYVPQDFVKEAANDYGEDSDFYRIRVLGLFPQTDNAVMFPDANAKIVEDIPRIEGYAVAGLDVAGPGKDYNVLVVRKGSVVVFLRKWKEADHVLLGRMVLDTLDYYGCRTLAIDSNGIGYGLTGFLSKEPGMTVIPIVGSEKAVNAKKYHNRRSEAFGRLKDIWKGLRFAKSGVTAEDLRIVAKEITPVRMYCDNLMRIAVSKKEEIKKELNGASPDLVDALAYAAIPQITAEMAEQQQQKEVELPGTRSRYK